MNSLRSSIVGLALFVGLTSIAYAQTLSITPALVSASDTVEQALQRNAGRASTALEGNGGTLALTYQADEQVEVFMVPIDTNGNFVPTDFLQFTLPATDEGTVTVDLTVSPGWSPGQKKWFINMLTEHQEATIGFSKLEIVSGGPATPLVAIRQLMTSEPYTPSSFHALRGYRTLGLPVAVILGIVTLIAFVITVLVASKEKRLYAGILVLLCGSALYQLRVGIDQLRFTKEHLSEFSKGTYDEAGSVSDIAMLVKEVATPNSTVYVCREGTNFKEKLLRYFTYPIRISSDQNDIEKADFALVMDATHWSLETTTANDASVQQLVCGSLKRTAQRITSFADGSILFRLP